MRTRADCGRVPFSLVCRAGTAVKVIRSKVLIGGLSTVQLLRVGRVLDAQPDIETIGPIADPIELLLAVREMNADAVILPLRGSAKAPGLCTHLLAEYSGLLVLAVSEDGRKTFMFANRIARRELAGGDEAILRTIRRVAAKNKEV